MATARYGDRRIPSVRPWWRPVVYSAAAAAAISALFNPVPALAAPAVPQAPAAAPALPLVPAAPPAVPQVPAAAPAVPDIGSRPMPLGTLLLPGQAAATPAASASPGAPATSPVVQRIEKGRAEISTLGDQLIRVGQDRDLARDQYAVAVQRNADAETVLREAQTAAADAAAAAMRKAAAMPPGTDDSGLLGLDDLARIQRGDGGSQQAAARQLERAQMVARLALDERTLTEQRYGELAAQYDTLNAELVRKQSAQQKLELDNNAELSLAEAIETAEDSRLGAEYLAGAEAGRGADRRAVQALEFALAQRGDPYVWSEEGPDQYDCSGLTYAAYRSVGFPLARVSRDQYWQTRNKVVDRYSLLPGDLLFFSYSNSWRGIHHVAMYAGNGMMVEAPRTGLNVRLVPVRWTRLFQATRVFGSVEGATAGPNLGAPDPEPAETTPYYPLPTTTRPSTPAGTPTTKPTTTSPTTTSPTTSPTTSSPTTQPTTTAPTTQPTTTAPTTEPTTSPTTSSPTPTPEPTTPAPEPSQTSSSTASSDSGSTTTSSTTSSTTAADSTSTSTSEPASSSTSSTTSTTTSTTTSSATATASG